MEMDLKIDLYLTQAGGGQLQLQESFTVPVHRFLEVCKILAPLNELAEKFKPMLPTR